MRQKLPWWDWGNVPKGSSAEPCQLPKSLEKLGIVLPGTQVYSGRLALVPSGLLHSFYPLS